MNRLTLAAALSLVALPALAGPDCSEIDASMPMWEVVKAFEENEGGSVEVAKITDDNCYEIYGRIDGAKVEIYYDPSSGAELEREEG